MLSDNDFKNLLLHFNRPWKGYRKVRKGVKKRLRRHMLRLGATSLEEYLYILEKEKVEKQLFENCLCVTISRFFRDRALWKYLQENILPQLFIASPGGLQVWSVGCAGGEEVFSLAIILDQRNRLDKVSILASDLREENLQRGQKGVYNSSSLKEVSASIISAYFSKTSTEEYCISTTLGERITWQRHDFLSKPPKGPFHLIFLRNNLLTYHQGPHQQRSLHRIVDSLAPKSFLIVGSHERVTNLAARLIPDNSSPYIYYKP